MVGKNLLNSIEVTSLALLERARAWEWVKDPPAGEGQVGHIQHCRAVTSFLNQFEPFF